MIKQFGKSMSKSLILVSLFIACSLGSIAQVVDSSLFFDPILDDIAKKIPPLEALIDSAVANSPEIQIEELQATWARYEILSAKRQWTKHFEIIGYSNAGLWLSNDRSEANTANNNFYLFESKRQTLNAGFGIDFPLISLIDRKNNINKQKKKLEIAIVSREVVVRRIRQIVITTYYELLQQQEKMKISNDYQQTSDIMMQNAEIMFRNAEIPPEEFNRQKDYQTRGAAAYAETVGRFNIAYTLLEELVGFKFNLINVLN